MVGTALGSVEEVDLDYGEVEWGEFMRIRFTIDITKPLLRHKKINLSLNDPVWVRFSYKRLPDFCYCCGLLGHTHKDSNMWGKTMDRLDQERLPYGIWMKAGPPNSVGHSNS